MLPSVVVGLLFAGLVLAMLAPSLVGGRILSAGDRTWFQPPFSAERPAGLVRPSNKDLPDPVEVFLPDLWRTREALHSGVAPLWTASVGGGRPLLASQQHAPLFPATWLAYVLPFDQAWAWIAALKLVAAAIGLYLLCRAFGLGVAAAALGGTTYAFSAYFVIWLEHPLTNAWALMPWGVLLTLALVRAPRSGTVLGLGVLLGVVLLAGHPESELFVLLAAAVTLAIGIGAGVRAGRLGSRDALWRLGWWVLALLAGVGLSAVVTLPVVELFRNSQPDPRGGLPPPASILVSWVFPEVFGRPDKDFYAPGPFSVYAERTAYLGALPTLLALGGLSWRPTRVQALFVGVAVLTLAVVMGTPVNALVRALPGGDAVALTRCLIFMVFAGSVLAAFGLQRLLDAPEHLRRRMLRVMAVATVVPLGAVVVHLELLSSWREAIQQLPVIHEHETSKDVVRLGAIWRWAVMAMGGVAIMAAILRWRPRANAALAVVVLVLTAVDLLTLNRDYHPQVSAALAAPPAPAALRTARAIAGDGRVMGSGRTFYPNLAARYDVRDPREHDHPVPERFGKLFDALGGGIPEPWIFSSTTPGLTKMANLFGARAILTENGGVQRNPDAVPRAWMAYSWHPVVDVDEALFSVVASSSSGLRDAPAIEGAPGAPAGAPAGPARLTRDGDERVDVEVRARRAGYLVLDDSFFPGWKATVDGHDARILPANVNFRAVSVPAGLHRVSFRYRPASAVVGAGISLATALLLAAAALVLVVRRRRRGAEGDHGPSGAGAQAARA
jgi:hypothetical protein